MAIPAPALRHSIALASALGLLAAAGCSGGGSATGVPATEGVVRPGDDPRVGSLLGKGLLPDVMTQIPEDLYVEDTGSELRLRLTNTYTNVGQGPLKLEGVNNGSVTEAHQHVLDAAGDTVAVYNVSEFAWHPTHGHWHIDDVSRYELRKGSPFGPTLAEATKVTFCMIDLWDQYPNLRSHAPDGEFWGCGDQYQGLSVGWSDIYSAGLPDQWIVIDDLKRGIYYLVSTANPNGKFIERDGVGEARYVNNPAWVKIFLDPAEETVEVLDSGLGDPRVTQA